MKKLLLAAVVTGAAIAAMFGGSASAMSNAARGDTGHLTKNGCTITTSLPEEGNQMNDSYGPSDFSRHGGMALIRYKAEGDCKGQRVSLASWYTTSNNGKPFTQQKLVDSKSRAIENGTSLINIDIPGADNQCYFQLDFVFGEPTDGNGTPLYGPDRLIQAVTGGRKDCFHKPEPIKVCNLRTNEIIEINPLNFNPEIHTRDLSKCKDKPELIKVCNLRTNEIVTIKKDNFNPQIHTRDLSQCKVIKVCVLKTKEIIKIKANDFNPKKHTRDLNKCKTTTVPGEIQVCVIKTKEIVTIKENAFDSTIHTQDLNVCQEVPETPEVPVTPTAELVKTGPASVAAIFAAVSVFAAVAHSIYARRRAN